MSDPESILVTGASGFLGRALISTLDARYRCVRGVRAKPQHPNNDAYLAYGDLAQAPELDHLTLNDIDVVVHCAGSAHSRPQSDEERAVFEAVNVHATRELARLARRDGVRHFILVSSIGIYGAPGDAGVLTDDSAAAPAEFYAETKLRGELALAEILDETPVHYTILRPTMIYGRNAPGNPARLQQLIRKLPLVPLGGVNNRRSFIYVENLAGLIGDIVASNVTCNDAHAVADPWVVSTAQMAQQLARHNVPARRLINVSPALLRLGARLIGRPDLAEKLLGSLEVDASRVWRQYDATPRFGWEQSFERMFAER